MKNPTIKFKAKPYTVGIFGSEDEWKEVSIPQLERRHCDMDAFRSNAQYGAYANSDLFTGMLNAIRSHLLRGREGLNLEELPKDVPMDVRGVPYKLRVAVDRTTFLNTVTIELIPSAV